MDILIRADASLEIGSGHVMRCLTLAAALQKRGATCHFVCRDFPGHLHEKIIHQNNKIDVIPSDLFTEVSGKTSDRSGPETKEDSINYQWQIDAQCTLEYALRVGPQWIIVDNYRLDGRWHGHMRKTGGKILVIDDLANRHYDCDILLDQTYGRRPDEYLNHVGSSAKLLVGTEYAMLRAEFGARRSRSLERRRGDRVRNILITLGGSDKDNYTSQVMNGLLHQEAVSDLNITVVMGHNAPWLEQVSRMAGHSPHDVRILVDVDHMDELMVESDLCIGAAGSTSWERCCLGLPTIMLVLAENQRTIAENLMRSGAVVVIDPAIEDVAQAIQNHISAIVDQKLLPHMAERASRICDGRGVERVMEHML